MDIAQSSLRPRIGSRVGGDTASGKEGVGTRLDSVELTGINVWGKLCGTIFAGKRCRYPNSSVDQYVLSRIRISD